MSDDEMTAEAMDRLGLASFLHGFSGKDGPACRRAADTILELFTKSIRPADDPRD